MKTIVALALLTALSVVAQPNGQFTFPIYSPVHDVSGPQHGYEDYTEVGFTVTHQANGAVTGQAIARYSDGFVYLSGGGPVTGRVTGNARTQRGRFKFSTVASGQDIYGGYRSGNYSWNGYGIHNEFSEESFIGTAKTSGCISGYGCRRDRVPVEVAAGSGEWNLQLNVTTAGSVVTGSAIAVHANSREFHYSVNGRYSPKTDWSMLKLTGIGSGLGSKLNVTTFGNVIVVRVTGKLLGQAVKHPQF